MKPMIIKAANLKETATYERCSVAENYHFQTAFLGSWFHPTPLSGMHSPRFFLFVNMGVLCAEALPCHSYIIV